MCTKFDGFNWKKIIKKPNPVMQELIGNRAFGKTINYHQYLSKILQYITPIVLYMTLLKI